MVVTSSPVGERSIVMTILSVCLYIHDHISGTTCPIFIKFFVYAIYVRVSVLLWRCCDMLRTSGIMDDVMFVDNGQEWASGNAVKR